MKKLILALACIVAVDVKALTYTDYTFEGYTYEEKMDTDQYKYEKTILNKFYKTTEIDSAYLESDLDGIYDGFDENDKKEETVFTRTLDSNIDAIAYVLTKADENPLITKVVLNSIENHPNQQLQEIEIYEQDRLVETTIPGYDFLNDGLMEAKNLLSNTIEIEFSRPIYLNDLKTKIYYEKGTAFYLTHNILDENGNSINRVYSTLNRPTGITVFETLDSTSHEKFITEHEFADSKVIYYYTYSKTLYRFYKTERVYLEEPLEQDTLDGYTYDPEESITAYRIYKREIIEEPDSSVDENIEPSTPIVSPSESTSTTDDSQNTSKPSVIISVPEPNKPSTSSTKTDEREHIITPIEYETKNDTGEKITDEMIKNNSRDLLLDSSNECETIYLINGRHVFIIAIIFFLLVLFRTLHKLYVNERD